MEPKKAEVLRLGRRIAAIGLRMHHTERQNQLAGKLRTVRFLAMGLVAFVLIGWSPAVRAQRAPATTTIPAKRFTLSVRDLQIPAKAQKALRHGEECLEMGDPARSLRHIHRAIHVFPGFYEAFYDEGIAEMLLGRKTDALQSFHKALDLSGGHYASAYVGYALVLAQQGNPKDAEPVVRRALEEDPGLSDAYSVLSIVLFQEGRLDEAEQAAHSALQMPNPLAGNAFFTLAQVHVQRGQYRLAVQDLESCVLLTRSGLYKSDAEFVHHLEKQLAEAKAKIASSSSETR